MPSVGKISRGICSTAMLDSVWTVQNGCNHLSSCHFQAFIFVVLDCAPACMKSMHTKAQPAEKKSALDAAAERLFHCRAAFLATLGIAATAPSSTHPFIHSSAPPSARSAAVTPFHPRDPHPQTHATTLGGRVLKTRKPRATNPHKS